MRPKFWSLLVVRNVSDVPLTSVVLNSRTRSTKTVTTSVSRCRRTKHVVYWIGRATGVRLTPPKPNVSIQMYWPHEAHTFAGCLMAAVAVETLTCKTLHSGRRVSFSELKVNRHVWGWATPHGYPTRTEISVVVRRASVTRQERIRRRCAGRHRLVDC